MKNAFSERAEEGSLKGEVGRVKFEGRRREV
jgi:hypothetical protein